MNYTDSSDYSRSADGLGGFVFEFDKHTLLSPSHNMSFFEVLKMPWNTERAVASVTIEKVLYSLNYDIFTLVQSKFHFSPTGALLCTLNMHSVDYRLMKSVSFVLLAVIFILTTLI